MMTKRTFYRWARDIVLILFAPAFIFFILVVSRQGKKNGLIWGHTPIINNKYWSEAMRGAGYHSWTLMSEFYAAINKKEDFDFYFDDIYSNVRPRILHRLLEPWLVMIYLARNARVLHLPFYGGVFKNTLLWRCESYLYRLAKIKTVIIPMGVTCTCTPKYLTHVLEMDFYYPTQWLQEERVLCVPMLIIG